MQLLSPGCASMPGNWRRYVRWVSTGQAAQFGTIDSIPLIPACAVRRLLRYAKKP